MLYPDKPRIIRRIHAVKHRSRLVVELQTQVYAACVGVDRMQQLLEFRVFPVEAVEEPLMGAGESKSVHALEILGELHCV